MGKSARIRKRKATAPDEAAAPAPAGPYFHGGAPGLQVDQILCPAKQLGARYQYVMPGAVYDASQVYITTDDGVAAAYASRYLDPAGRSRPGDVYEVQPMETPQPDEDYAHFPDVFLQCQRARIVRVIARAVSLTKTEQAKRERPYVVWDHRDSPMWDADGLINPSEQMAANGVTREWTTMLQPWLGPNDVDGQGKLMIAARSNDLWRTVLDVVPCLDRDCQIETVRRGLRRQRSYRCRVCGHCPSTESAAILHQLGPRAVVLLTRIHEWDTAPLPPLVNAAIVRNTDRWRWLLDERGIATPTAETR